MGSTYALEKLMDSAVDRTTDMVEALNVLRRVHSHVNGACCGDQYSKSRHKLVLKVDSVLNLSDNSAFYRHLEAIAEDASNLPSDFTNTPKLALILKQDLEEVGERLAAVKIGSDRLVKGVDAGLRCLSRALDARAVGSTAQDLADRLEGIHDSPTHENVNDLFRLSELCEIETSRCIEEKLRLQRA
jgi:hypothetical protein